MSGPAASGNSEIAPAIEAFFEYANALGGVNGRKVSLYYQDDQYNPATTVKVVKQLVQKYNVFALVAGFETTSSQNVEPYLTQRQIPDLFVGSGCNCWSSPSSSSLTFGFGPSYATQGLIIGKIIDKKFPNAKVGVIYQDNSFGTAGLLGLRQGLGSNRIVATQSYDTSSLSSGLGEQIQALKNAGVNLIVSFSIPEATALELIAQNSLGVKITTFTSANSADPLTVGNLINTLSLGKISGSAAVQGIYSLTFLPTLASQNDPWIRLFTKIHAEYDSSLPLDNYTIYGMSIGYVTLEALLHSGRNPTRLEIVNWLNKPGSTLMGPGLVPLSYAPNNHQGYSGAQLTLIQNGTSTPLGPIYKINVNGKMNVTHSYELPPPKSLLS